MSLFSLGGDQSCQILLGIQSLRLSTLEGLALWSFLGTWAEITSCGYFCSLYILGKKDKTVLGRVCEAQIIGKNNRMSVGAWNSISPALHVMTESLLQHCVQVVIQLRLPSCGNHHCPMSFIVFGNFSLLELYFIFCQCL